MRLPSNLNNAIGAILFIAAYYILYWVPDLSDRLFDLVWNLGLIAIFWRRKEWVFILISCFLKWRVLDELIGNPYLITQEDFLELFLVLAFTVIEYCTPIFTSVEKFLTYEPKPTP